ncbi:MAG: histidine kinase [Bacteroidales bacterium]|nr:histidine kinase [Bacteroidales bacterium]
MNFDIRPLKLIISIIFLSIAASSTLFAQFPVIKNYTVNDGLPSSKVYDIAQDSAGYLWIATESGISRFDGYDFKNYTKPDGLPSNSIVKLYVDYKNRLWFSTYQGEVGYIMDDKVVIHWISQDTSLRNHVFYDHIYIDTSETIYLTPFSGGLIIIKDKELSYHGRYKFSDKPEFKYALFYKDKPYGNILGLANLTVSPLEDLKKHYPDFGIVHFNHNSYEKTSLYHKNLIPFRDSCFLLSLGQELKCVFDDKVVFTKNFSQEIIKLTLDSHNNLWISVKFKGVFLYRNGDLSSDPIQFLNNNIISGIIEDEEGSYWFSSTDEGLFYVASVDFINYSREMLQIDDNVVQSIAVNDNSLYFSTSNMGFYKAVLEGNKLNIDKNFKLEGKVYSTIPDILIKSNNELWVSSTQYLRYNLNGERILNFNAKNMHNGYSLVELKSHDVLLGVSTGYYNYHHDNWVSYSWQEDFEQKTFCFYQTEDSVLFLGTLSGLYFKKDEKIKHFDASSAILGSRISAIGGNDLYIFVGTFDNGLVVINRADKSVQYINESKGLLSHRVKSICVKESNKVWIGSNQGLSELTINNFRNSDISIRNFTIWDGLPSNEINDIEKNGSNLVLATNKGIVQFNPQGLTSKNILPEVRMESVRVNDLKNNFKDQEISFKYDQNNIEFSFKLKSFKEPQRANYLYKLEGFEDEWYLTRNTSIRYPKLHPGDYRFIVKAKSYAGEWSDTIEYSFTIKKHFTQYLAFQIAMIVAIISIIFLIVYIIVATFRNREELKRQAILAEQKAVRSQMNPHFIFNSLNSIQNFIVEKDDKNANLYLVIFSSLIRRILEASKHNFISLKEEIETIKLYLELEKFRFEKHFDYSIDLDTSINADQVSIPSMLLQPYLENAIWHGIVPKQSKGVLKVEFKLVEPGLMKISIIDDGIGRVRAAEINKRRKHHKPTGMKNVEERLGLLNKLNNTNMRVKIIDLYDDQNFAIGTRVDFLIEI